MKTNESLPSEYRQRLMEIANVKTEINKLYKKTGPVSSDYITLSIKLDLLMKEYIEEQIANL